uniref:DUF281 domain-containing protein n=1 Tax=Caenorhabditis tropicalis TaxID=1561998 RepID=A0A1I7TUQ3_9PELO
MKIVEEPHVRQCLATTPTGYETLGYTSGTSVLESSALLTCQPDGNYSAGIVEQISQLSCVFNGCYPPSCNSCDVNRIRPTTMPPDTEFTFE